jgi:hypothetical protein
MPSPFPPLPLVGEGKHASGHTAVRSYTSRPLHTVNPSDAPLPEVGLETAPKSSRNRQRGGEPYLCD